MPADTIGGMIAPFDAADATQRPDLDYFSVRLEAGDVFEFEIAAQGAGISAEGLYVTLSGSDDNPIFMRRSPVECLAPRLSPSVHTL